MNLKRHVIINSLGVMVAIAVISAVTAILYREQSPSVIIPASQLKQRAEAARRANSLEKELAKQPTNTAVVSEIAVAYYNAAQYEKAIEAYQQLIELNQSLAFAWTGLGNTYRDSAEQTIDTAERERINRQAIEAYQASISRDAQYLLAYTNLAQLFIDLGRTDEAEAVIQQGLAVHPDNSALTSLQKQQ